MTEPLLSVRGLTTRFRTERGTVNAVDDVSFDVAAGETLAIVGESGSGKSVTALSLLRLVPDPPGRIEAGQILFEGQDLLELDDAAMRAVRGNRIAMIFQEPMTSRSIRLEKVGDAGGRGAGHASRRTSWSAKRGLQWPRRAPRPCHACPDPEKKLMQTYPHELLRRHAPARDDRDGARLPSPGCSIADEPTTALDVTVQAQILDLMKASCTREYGMAIADPHHP